MDLRFDLWHLAFTNLIQMRAPPNFEVQSEVRLNIEPQRADMLLLRRRDVANEDDRALVLRALWPRLGLAAILEYKSPVESSFRRGDLLRLIGYGVLYDTAHLDELKERDDLTLVLVVASITPTLLDEMARMGFVMTPLGGGYARIEDTMYTTFLVVTDDVTETERDEYLRLFSHRRAKDGEATRWLQQWMRETKMKQPDIEDLPGFEELFQKSIERAIQKMPAEERLAGLAPQERLAGLAPQERLAGLGTEQLILALPVDVLRGLREEYLRSLPIEIQQQIAKRLRETSH